MSRTGAAAQHSTALRDGALIWKSRKLRLQQLRHCHADVTRFLPNPWVVGVVHAAEPCGCLVAAAGMLVLANQLSRSALDRQCQHQQQHSCHPTATMPSDRQCFVSDTPKGPGPDGTGTLLARGVWTRRIQLHPTAAGCTAGLGSEFAIVFGGGLGKGFHWKCSTGEREGPAGQGGQGCPVNELKNLAKCQTTNPVA